jgi:tetratricopeptide (TPR) repeat protein
MLQTFKVLYHCLSPHLILLLVLNVMVIKDYKSKDTHRNLGLRRGKTAIKKETSSITPVRIGIWAALFALVAFVNYVVFLRLEPINKKGLKIGPAQEERNRADTFAEWFDKGCKKHQEGELRGAVEAYTEAIVLKPEEIRSYFSRGIVYIQLGMLDKAINDYNTVIALNPDYTEAYHNRGRAYLQKGQFDLSILDCSTALDLDPHMATAYHTRGKAYKGKGLVELAKKDFQKSCVLGDVSGCRDYKKISETGNNGI